MMAVTNNTCNDKISSINIRRQEIWPVANAMQFWRETAPRHDKPSSEQMQRNCDEREALLPARDVTLIGATFPASFAQPMPQITALPFGNHACVLGWALSLFCLFRSGLILQELLFRNPSFWGCQATVMVELITVSFSKKDCDS